MKVLMSVLISILACVGGLFQFEIFNTEFINDDYNVKVVVDGIRSEKGKIVLAVFEDQKNFKLRNPVKRIELKKSELKGNEILLSVETGIYGISILDDENNNNKMDYNFVGIPKEGFGFSNYYHTGISKPQFDKFKFEIDNKKVVLIEIKVKYM